MFKNTPFSSIRRISTAVFAVAALCAVAGCGSNGRGSVGSDFDPEVDPTDYRKAQLREQVREMIVETRQEADRSGAELRNYKPYFFKEFRDYPAGPESYEIDFVESESRVVPLLADVHIEQLRFVTDVQSSKVDARTDTTFFREVGTQTISYEYRNGEWDRMASLFIADEVQHLVNGEWEEVPPQPRDQTVYDASERPGFFRRLFGRLRLGENETAQSP